MGSVSPGGIAVIVRRFGRAGDPRTSHRAARTSVLEKATIELVMTTAASWKGRSAAGVPDGSTITALDAARTLWSSTTTPAPTEIEAGDDPPESGRPGSNRRRPAWEAG
ncbi:MAG: hypothetical protein ABJC36_10850, partial [Gemmatimonadales bacterium]